MGSEELKARARHYRELAEGCGTADLARLLNACAAAYESEASLFDRLLGPARAEPPQLA